MEKRAGSRLRWIAARAEAARAKRKKGRIRRRMRPFSSFMVREAGLEPARRCGRQDLNLVRLPI
ncbi:hypothetical protein, partial [Paraburkholderia sp.]|uniref:hypothetical protein n=1 Tax=Paraburkholderia sp. TaxID=1926495 RepID=UPI002F3EF134